MISSAMSRLKICNVVFSVSSVQAERGSGVVDRRRLSASASGSFEQDEAGEDVVLPYQVPFRCKFFMPQLVGFGILSVLDGP